MSTVAFQGRWAKSQNVTPPQQPATPSSSPLPRPSSSESLGGTHDDSPPPSTQKTSTSHPPHVLSEPPSSTSPANSQLSAAGTHQSDTCARGEVSVHVTYATVHYSPRGMHVKFALQCVSHDDALRWVVHKRFTECRLLHLELVSVINKKNSDAQNSSRVMRFLKQNVIGRSPLPAFPERFVGSTNRSKKAIEQRRKALQEYFSGLCDTASPHYLILRPYLLTFIKHPDCANLVPSWPQSERVGGTSGGRSTSPQSGNVSEGESGNAVPYNDGTSSEVYPYDSDDAETTSSVVDTVWRLGSGCSSYFDPHMLISLPYAHIGLDVDDKPHIIIRADRNNRANTRAALQHRFDEFVSFCQHVASYGPSLPTCDDAHEFFLTFRRQHPLAQTNTTQQRDCDNPLRREHIPDNMSSASSDSDMASSASAASNGSSSGQHRATDVLVPPSALTRGGNLTGYTYRMLHQLNVEAQRRKCTSTNTKHFLYQDDKIDLLQPHPSCRCTDTCLCWEPTVSNKFVTRSNFNIIISPPGTGGNTVAAEDAQGQVPSVSVPPPVDPTTSEQQQQPQQQQLTSTSPLYTQQSQPQQPQQQQQHQHQHQQRSTTPIRKRRSLSGAMMSPKGAAVKK